MLDQDADDLNLLASFLARRGVRSPEDAGADVVVVLGNSVIESVIVAARCFPPPGDGGQQVAPPPTPSPVSCGNRGGGFIVFSGGIGHSTDDLRRSARKVCPEVETEGRSEAEIMRDVAVRCGVPEERTILEDRSTNTGENVAFSRRVLEERGIAPKRILIVQDPTMQLRAHATFQKVWADRPEVRLTSFAPFVPHVVVDDGELRLDNPGVRGVWPFERFVGLLLGEISRLREYGPSGKGFIAQVEVPSQVEGAYERLAAAYERRPSRG